jgi:hypothetical protein
VNSLGFANTNDLLFAGGIEIEVGCFIGTNLSNDNDDELSVGTDTDVRGGGGFTDSGGDSVLM